MTVFHRLLITALLMSLAVPATPLASQTGDDDPCACPVPRESRGGGLGGLFGLAALGLARVGAGVRSVVAEAVEQPVVVVAAEDSVLPLGVAAAPILADTARDTTDVALTAPAAAPVLGMAAPRDAAPAAVLAPRTATPLPLLALLGLSAVLTGAAMRLRKRPLAADGAPHGDRPWSGPGRTILLIRKRPRRARYRVR